MLLLTILFATIAWPLVLSVALQSALMRTLSLRLSPWAAFPALLLAIFSPQALSIDIPLLLLGSVLGLDQTGKSFLLLTGLLWGLSGWHARTSLPQAQQARFYTWFNLALAGNIGLILALDMLSFYLFFTLMSFASYGLIVHVRTANAWRAGKLYIILVVLGEAALFAALLLAASATGSLSFESVRPLLAQSEWLNAILLLAWLGFGIKVSVLGLHVWLPLAHPVAPAPASAVLSGVMIKAGLLGWLRLLPLGEVSLEYWGALWIVLGLAAAFYAALIGLTQRDPKTLLAYSSISQMGILTAAIGLGLMAPLAWPATLIALLVYILHHGLTKGALFLGAGMLHDCNTRSQKWIWAGFWLPALALAGAPFTSGMLAKSLLKMQTLQAPENWLILWEALLPVSAITTALLLGKFLLLTSPSNTVKPAGHVSPFNPPWPWGILLLSIAALPLVTHWIEPFHWSWSLLLGSMWPILVASMIVYLITRPTPRLIMVSKALGALHIPPGDILAGYERVTAVTLRGIQRLSYDYLPRLRESTWRLCQAIGASLDWRSVSEKLEIFLSRWPLVMTGFVLLGLIIATQKLLL